MSAARKSLTIAGEKVFLRVPVTRDGAEFLALNRASERLHRGYVSPPTNADEYLALLKRFRRPDCAGFFICRNEDRAIVGAIILSQIIRGNFQNAFLGYYMGEPYAGRGYMTEALRLILRYGFTQLKIHRIEANIQPGNAGSLALVRNAGFVLEGFSRRYLKMGGRWRDHERWAIVAEQWRPKAPPPGSPH